MPEAHRYLKALLSNLSQIRERAGITENQLEEKLILGPGWVRRFEVGDTVPSIDMLLAILHETEGTLDDLVKNLPEPDPAAVERCVFGEPSGDDLLINFRYANYDAQYRLNDSTLEDFEKVIKTLRNGLALLVSLDEAQSKAIKTDSVARTFLQAVKQWPHASPSDLWWFVVYRAYCDPYNHPAHFARLDFTQSWKRTGGWALEEILVRHYGPFLEEKGVNLFIADAAAKQQIVRDLKLGHRVEADKIDVVLTGRRFKRQVFFGVVHVKASFAERRTDDIPLSIALKEAGYASPLWTMDCKSMPGTKPVNRGELGGADGRRSAKRKDIEDEGYFTGCFSYNKRTLPSRSSLPKDRRIYVCDFKNPDDVFSQFILRRWRAFRSA